MRGQGASISQERRKRPSGRARTAEKVMKHLIAPLLIAVALAGPAAAETRSLSGFQAVDAEDRGRELLPSVQERLQIRV